MANTFELISSTTLGSSAASHTFSSIPATFNDLLVVVSTRTDSATIYGGIYAKFNGSSSGYTARDLQGNGSAASSYSDTAILMTSGVGASATANTFSNAQLYIPNYASSNYKSTSTDSVGENNATTAFINLDAALWSNTAAITSITLSTTSGNMVANSTFSLYGVKNV